MNNPIFNPIAKVIGARRPTWTFILEDNVIRVSTMQFVVNWKIIDEIINAGDFEIEDVLTHATLGVVITIAYTGGK